jgi:protocatechuate 3,4-dioxygenase beta subunit
VRARATLSIAFAVVVLSGSVFDRTTGQPLRDVRIVAGTHTATTDVHGRYALRVLKRGPLAITLESDDVPPQHFTVTVGAGTTHADFRACSTTLDYNCGAPAPSFGNGNG